jgi:hypothetical protein
MVSQERSGGHLVLISSAIAERSIWRLILNNRFADVLKGVFSNRPAYRFHRRRCDGSKNVRLLRVGSDLVKASFGHFRVLAQTVLFVEVPHLAIVGRRNRERQPRAQHFFQHP